MLNEIRKQSVFLLILYVLVLVPIEQLQPRLLEVVLKALTCSRDFFSVCEKLKSVYH